MQLFYLFIFFTQNTARNVWHLLKLQKNVLLERLVRSDTKSSFQSRRRIDCCSPGMMSSVSGLDSSNYFMVNFHPAFMTEIMVKMAVFFFSFLNESFWQLHDFTIGFTSHFTVLILPAGDACRQVWRSLSKAWKRTHKRELLHCRVLHLNPDERNAAYMVEMSLGTTWKW